MLRSCKAALMTHLYEGIVKIFADIEMVAYPSQEGVGNDFVRRHQVRRHMQICIYITPRLWRSRIGAAYRVRDVFSINVQMHPSLFIGTKNYLFSLVIKNKALMRMFSHERSPFGTRSGSSGKEWRQEARLYPSALPIVALFPPRFRVGRTIGAS